MLDNNFSSSSHTFTDYQYRVLNRIQRELTQQKISQKKLGEACGLSQPSISKLLNGSSPLTLEFLYKVCDILNITMDSLLSTKDTLPDKMSVMDPNIQDIMHTNQNSFNDAIVSDPSLYPFKLNTQLWALEASLNSCFVRLPATFR